MKRAIVIDNIYAKYTHLKYNIEEIYFTVVFTVIFCSMLLFVTIH